MLRRPAAPFTPRRAALATIGAAFCLALPSAASAATVHIDAAEDNVEFQAVPGENNDLQIEEDGDVAVFTDSEGVTAGVGCVQSGATAAACPLNQFDGIVVLLGNGQNSVDALQSTEILVNGSQGSSNEIDSFGAPTTALGGPGNDDLHTGSDDDYLFGGPGDDELRAGWGIDTLRGGLDNDYLDPDYGSDDIEGNGGFDQVSYAFRGNPMNLSIDDVANDGVVGENDNIHTDVERIDSGDGDDHITGSDGPNQLFAGGGDDLVSGGAGNDGVHGEDGDDDVRGDLDVDYVRGGPDQDEVNGGSGDDFVYGGSGDDFVNGSIGHDDVFGGPDADLLAGGPGNDELNGDDGDDNLRGQDGGDVLAGGTGTVTVDYFGYSAPVTVDLDGSDLNDGIYKEGDSVRADVENATGGSGDDTITGNGNYNVLIGAAGDDTLRSKDGAEDAVDCGVGNDAFDADPVDKLAGCELAQGQQVPQQPAPPTGDPATQPKLLIGPGNVRISRSRVAKLSVRCPAGAAACTGTLRLQRVVKGKVRTLGRKRFSVRPGARAKVRIKVSRSVAKSVARRPLRVNAVAGDASRKVTLKPAARRKR